MRIIIQRTSKASVAIDGNIKAAINQGYLILVGIGLDDTAEDIDWLVGKVVSLRIFSDVDGKMNLSIKAIDGDILVISQFTLHAKVKKGNRPSYIKAAPPEIAIPLYETFKKQLSEKLGKPIKSGEFGAKMQVSLINDGPVTISIDSRNRE